MKKIVVVSGSVRDGRKSHFVAELLHREISTFPETEALLLDLKNYAFPVMEKRMDQMVAVPEALRDFSDTLSDAHGILIVSPEYKNGIPGGLKNAFDYLAPQILKRRPVGIATVSSGGFGGLLCLSQLRTIALALGGLPIPEKLCVSNVNQVFDASGALLDDSLQRKTLDFTEDFLWYVGQLS